MSKKKEKFDWLDSANYKEGTFDMHSREVWATPDWVRHPERYPELTKRLGELARELWHEEEEKK